MTIPLIIVVVSLGLLGQEQPLMQSNARSELGEAVAKNDRRVVRRLLLEGADPNSMHVGRPVLSFAFNKYSLDAKRDRSVLQMLLIAGADPNSIEVYRPRSDVITAGSTDVKLAEYRTPVFFRIKTVEELRLVALGGANLSLEDNSGNNMAHAILIMVGRQGGGHPSNDAVKQIIELLIDNDIDVNKENRAGFKPLHYISIGRESLYNDLIKLSLHE